MNVGKLVCKVRGHEWEKVPVVRDVHIPKKVVGECKRCGDTAEGWEAMSYGGRDIPRELVDQDGVDELQAMYAEGKIDDEELEYFLDRAISKE